MAVLKNRRLISILAVVVIAACAADDDGQSGDTVAPPAVLDAGARSSQDSADSPLIEVETAGGDTPGAPDAPDTLEPADSGPDVAAACDADGDGFAAIACGGDDCDDTRETTNPAMPEVCGNGLDDDCSGVPDDRDLDGDGAIAKSCGGPDCHDGDPTIAPGLLEICGNGVDEDCSGALDDLDQDGDGVLADGCGVGDDCDDTMPTTYPGAVDYVEGACTTTGSWAVVELAPNAGPYARLAVAPDGLAFVAYESGDGHLQLVKETGDGYETTLVDPDPGTGTNLDIVVDADGVVHMSYLDLPNSRLKYATTKPGFLALVIVEQGFVGWFSSLGVSKEGVVHISYTDVEEEDLHYAVCQAGCDKSAAWTLETVNSEGQVGKHTSLQLDASGAPHISYWDESESSLQVAHLLPDGTWAIEVVDKGPTLGWASHLLLGAEPGTAHITYLDQGAGLLRYAYRAIGGWQPQTVGAAIIGPFLGQSTSIALDVLGRPHIAFTDDTKHGLKYARCLEMCGAACCEGQWNVTSADPVIVLGQAASIAMGQGGTPLIAYTGGKAPQASLRLALAPCLDSPLDDNCDGVDGTDADGDGYPSLQTGGNDCADEAPALHPEADDPPGDGIDWDCDGKD